MKSRSGVRPSSRRKFLTTSGSVLAAAVAAPSIASALDQRAEPPAGSSASSQSTPAAGSLRKIPIGVFDPAFPDLSLDQMLDKVQSSGLEAMEIGTGGYPDNKHCPLDDLLADPGKLRTWERKFADHNLAIGALSCHGNPVHPDSTIANRDAQTFRKTVQLAEKIGVSVIVGFSGCPGGSPSDKNPSWITYG